MLLIFNKSVVFSFKSRFLLEWMYRTLKNQHLLPKNNNFVENQQQWCYVYRKQHEWQFCFKKTARGRQPECCFFETELPRVLFPTYSTFGAKTARVSLPRTVYRARKQHFLIDFGYVNELRRSAIFLVRVLYLMKFAQTLFIFWHFKFLMHISLQKFSSLKVLF